MIAVFIPRMFLCFRRACANLFWCTGPSLHVVEIRLLLPAGHGGLSWLRQSPCKMYCAQGLWLLHYAETWDRKTHHHTFVLPYVLTYMYACSMHTYGHAYRHACRHTYTHTHIYIDIHAYSHAAIHIQVYHSISIYLYIFISLHIYICISIHLYIYISIIYLYICISI